LLDFPAELSPPAPIPRERALGPIALLRVLASNPLEAWTAAHFEEPIVTTGLSIGRVAVVNEPAAIRRVLMTNTENYQKDWLQRRMLSGALANGLLTVESDQWKLQRRALAPLFSRKTVLSFSAAMIEAAEALIDRLHQREGQTSRTNQRASRWTCWSAPFFRTASGAIRMRCAPRCRISIQSGASIRSIF
jgi:cytochrome P450